MKAFSTPQMKNKSRAAKLGGVIFWLALWQAAAMILNKSIILVTPAAAAKRLIELLFVPDFYRTAGNSFIRISAGFFAGAAGGIILASLAAAFSVARTLITPLMSAVKSVPVASFVILALFWMKSSVLSVFVSFLIVLPVFYGAVYEGICSTDSKLIEAAEVFGMSMGKRIRYLYFPAVMPFLGSACTAASGLAFKSGAAAEVIGQPDLTIGDMLYRSKIYLETADLFAWTAVIILLSMAFERIVRFMLDLAYKLSVKGGVCSDDN